MKTHPIFKKLDEMSTKLNEVHKILSDSPLNLSRKYVINNEEFMELLGISSGTAANWRKQGKIAFKKVNNKIYYQMIDVLNMLEIDDKDLKSE